MRSTACSLPRDVAAFASGVLHHTVEDHMVTIASLDAEAAVMQDDDLGDEGGSDLARIFSRRRSFQCCRRAGSAGHFRSTPFLVAGPTPPPFRKTPPRVSPHALCLPPP